MMPITIQEVRAMEHIADHMTERELADAAIRMRNLRLEMASSAIKKTRAEDDSDEPWQMRALCGQTDPDAFHPERGTTPKDAKKICARCDVVPQCLEAALAMSSGEDFGVWGNTTEQERREIRRQRKAALEQTP
jgi:hypothetical protein